MHVLLSKTYCQWTENSCRRSITVGKDVSGLLKTPTSTHPPPLTIATMTIPSTNTRRPPRQLVYGYALDNDWLSEKAQEQFGAAHNALEGIRSDMCVVSKLLDDSDLRGIAAVRCVFHDGTVKLCIALAENNKIAKVSISEVDNIRVSKLQTLLGTTDTPKWYVYH